MSGAKGESIATVRAALSKMGEDKNFAKGLVTAMEEKMNRVIEYCSNLDDNPILSIHDQGAGGTGNVTKEIVYPNGALINLDLSLIHI